MRMGRTKKEDKDGVEKIRSAKQLFKEGYNSVEVAAKLGLSQDQAETIKKAYEISKAGEEDKTSNVEERVMDDDIVEEMDDEDVENRGLLPYPRTIKPPEEFFREFIEPYGVKKDFLTIYYERIKRRKELPHPNELAADLADMKSGITNARAINYIAEEYSYALQDYLREVGENERMLRTSFGIKVGMPKPYNPGYPGPVDPYQHYQPTPYPGNPYAGYPQQPSYPGYPVYPNYNHPGYPGYMGLQPPMTQGDSGLRKEIEELKRLIRERDAAVVRSKDNGYTHQLLARIEKLEDELKERDRERIERLEQQLREATMRQGFSERDAEQIVRRIMDEYHQRVTPDDVRKILKEEVGKITMGMSKDDRDFLISKEKLEIEREKLKEKSKTREAIAEAVKTGFSSIGQALSRTLLEAGSNTEYAVQGYSNANESLWQVQCPSCGAMITAPIGSKVIQCPNCGRRYTVESAPTGMSNTSNTMQTTIDNTGSIEGVKPNSIDTSVASSTVEVKVPEVDVSKPISNVDTVIDTGNPFDERLTCPICGRKYASRYYLVSHMKKKHNIDLDKYDGDILKAAEDYNKERDNRKDIDSKKNEK